jgi:hypothetical protein
MLRKVSSTINMNKMSVLGLTFVDIDGQSLAFFYTRIPIFTRNNILFYSKLDAFYWLKVIGSLC